MKLLMYRFLIVVLALSGFYSGQAQKKFNPILLLGSWALEKQVFLEPNEDSLDIKNENVGLVLTFKKGNSFLTQKRVGKTLKLIGTGTYKIDAEGKYLYQNDMECEIIELTDKWLVFKVDETVELHFKKLNSLK